MITLCFIIFSSVFNFFDVYSLNLVVIFHIRVSDGTRNFSRGVRPLEKESGFSIFRIGPNFFPIQILIFREGMNLLATSLPRVHNTSA